MNALASRAPIDTETNTQMPPLNHAGALGLHLRCTRCGAEIGDMRCEHCGLQMAVHEGIVYALPPERTAHYAQFIADYESIRSAEGRGSNTSDFYLGLPYQDTTGRNADQWRIRARSFDCLLEQVLRPRGVHTVLDLGAGNCWMTYRLAVANFATFAVDLLTNNRDGLGAAIHFERMLARPIPRFQAEAAHLPFADEQFDAIVFNASFHYAEDYEAVLREALRCTRRRGIVVISDTPWYTSESSGERMVAERQGLFLRRYGTASQALRSQVFLTDERLSLLEEQCGIRWQTYSPDFGLRWTLRPWIAKMRGRREPSRFRIYVAENA